MKFYEKSFFIGEEKKKHLTGFPGKIQSVEKQSSGNFKITLSKKVKDVTATRIAFFKKLEVEKYNLEDVLLEGNDINIFGIMTTKNKIFPVCFVEFKGDDGKKVAEIEENAEFYLAFIEVNPHSKQKTLI
ncbi:MAG: hypothetical protein ACTSUE_04230 [Promethearchaeota archaeon]